MTLTHELTIIKPSVDVPWFSPPENYKNYIKENYIDTGIITSRTVNDLDDGLTKIITTEFVNPGIYFNLYIKDPTILEYKELTVAHYQSINATSSYKLIRNEEEPQV